MEIGRIASRGIAYSGAVQIIRILISFISAVITARLLSPYDFGVVASAMPIFVVCQVLQNAGITQAIVQTENMSPGNAGALFAVSVFLSFFFAGIFIISVPVIEIFLGVPELRTIINYICFGLVLGAVANQGTSLLSAKI